MPLPTRTGTYLARPVTWGLQKSSQGKPQFGVEFELLAFRDEGEWFDCTEYDFKITGYLTLVKNDGSLNDIACKQIAAALGWDPATGVGSLETEDWSGVECRIQVGKWVKRDGAEQMQVQGLYHKDDEGGGRGLTSADQQTIDELSGMLDHLLAAEADSIRPSRPATERADANLNAASKKKSPF